MDFNSIEDEVYSNILCESSNTTSPVIFVLGSPRTGSTVLYQSLVAHFELPFFSNFTDLYYHDCPILGLLIQKSMDNLYKNISYQSKYGKSEGIFQVSEASRIMTYFFGGGHPSQIKSTEILSHEKEFQLVKLLKACYHLYGKPLIIKNAWNCFRLNYLTSNFPDAYFIWIRRDLFDSSSSDLSARYATKNDPNEWNSATPANVDCLRNKHYCEQVVDNQYEFYKAIKKECNERFIEIWYEDFCENPLLNMKEIARFCNISEGNKTIYKAIKRSANNSSKALREDEILHIKSYIDSNQNTFSTMMRSI